MPPHANSPALSTSERLYRPETLATYCLSDPQISDFSPETSPRNEFCPKCLDVYEKLTESLTVRSREDVTVQGANKVQIPDFPRAAHCPSTTPSRGQTGGHKRAGHATEGRALGERGTARHTPVHGRRKTRSCQHCVGTNKTRLQSEARLSATVLPTPSFVKGQSPLGGVPSPRTRHSAKTDTALLELRVCQGRRPGPGGERGLA